MRSQLLCAVVFLCAAGAAHAQGWPVAPGYPNGYMPNYPPMGYVPQPVMNGGVAPVQGFHYSNGYPSLPPYQGPPVSEPVVTSDAPAPHAEFHGGGKPMVDNCTCWFGLDYSFSWIRREDKSVPLVTTSSMPTAQRAGAIGSQGTSVLASSDAEHDLFSGVRGEFGFFCNEHRTLSLEVAGLYLIPQTDKFTVASNGTGNPAIFRPVFQVGTTPNSEIAFITALPNVATGRVDVEAKSELFGYELNGRMHHTFIENKFYADALLGFRYLRLAETLATRDQFSPLAPNVLTFLGQPAPVGSQISDTDTFLTTNKFYGAQVGGRIRFEGECFLLHVQGKVAVGATDQESGIYGLSRIDSQTSTSRIAGGGVLALPSNVGSYNRTLIGVVPEAGFNIGWKIHQCLQMQAGYSFLYWTNVLRPSAQIDRSINATAAPTASVFGQANNGTLRPLYQFNGEPFWVQSVNLRVIWSY